MKLKARSCLWIVMGLASILCLCCPVLTLGGAGILFHAIPAIPLSVYAELSGMENQGTVDAFWAQRQPPEQQIPDLRLQPVAESQLPIRAGSTSPTGDTFLDTDHPFFDYLWLDGTAEYPIVVYRATQAEANHVCTWSGDYCAGKIYDVDFKPGGLILYEAASGVSDQSGVMLFVDETEVSWGGIVIDGQVYTGSDSYLADTWETPINDLNDNLGSLFIQVAGERLPLQDAFITEDQIFLLFHP